MILEPGILAPLFILLYAYMFFRLWKHGKKDKAKNKNEENQLKAEVKLTIIGFILSFCYVEMYISYIFYAAGYYHLIIDCMFNYGSDLFSGSNPYMLLGFSKLFRGYFIEFCTCRKINVKVKPITNGTGKPTKTIKKK